MQFNFTSMIQYLYSTQRINFVTFGMVAAMILLLGQPAMAEDPPAKTSQEVQSVPDDQATDPNKKIFAIVDDVKITMRDYNFQYAVVQRERYYHAKVQEHKLAEFQREIRDQLIEKALLMQEARRRADPVDSEELQRRLDEGLAQFDKRYSNDEAYQKNRDDLIKSLKINIATSMRVRDMEKNIRDAVVDPGDEELKHYYQENLELFTQPGQYRLSVILLGIDPSAGAQAIMDTIEQANSLVKAMRSGSADFAEMAEAISADKSSVNGGDMGYQHQGMLAPGVEAMLNEMSVGDISEPIRVLEGVSIFRLDDRILPNVQPFDVVRERVLGLWLREHKDKAWNDLISGLKAKAKIVVYDDFFAPLPDKDKPTEDKENQGS